MKLINRLIGILLLGICTLLSESYAQNGVIELPISYKVIVNPADGTRPIFATNEEIRTAVEGMNMMQASYFRGFRFKLVEIIEIGNIGGFLWGPSQWYNINFHGEGGGSLKDRMERAAKRDSVYLWRENTINIYLANGFSGGICSFSNAGDDIIIIGKAGNSDAPLQLHEIGHYFNLYHTQGRTCGGCDDEKRGKCHTRPGDDNIDDTLPDLQCWTKDQISGTSFGGTGYDQLSPANKKIVDDVAYNIMSYHHEEPQFNILTQLTEDQLDKWTKTANNGRSNITSAKTRIVGKTYDRVWGAYRDANPNDIILIRPGSYPENRTFDKAVTFRATRKGFVSIGTGSEGRSEDNLLMEPSEERESLAKMLKEMGAVSEDGATLGFAGRDTEEDRHHLPHFQGLRTFPNPFTYTTTLEFELQDPQPVTLRIRDIMGKDIKVLIDSEPKQAGLHSETFSGADLPAGVYLATLEANGVQSVQKLILQK